MPTDVPADLLFPAWVLGGLVKGALALSGLALAWLLLLLWNDWRRGSLW